MDDATLSAAHATDHAHSVAQDELLDAFSEPDLISDDEIDYDSIAAENTAGSITFSASDYASDEEMMAAVEAFVMKCCKGAADETAG